MKMYCVGCFSWTDMLTIRERFPKDECSICRSDEIMEEDEVIAVVTKRLAVYHRLAEELELYLI